MNTVAFVELETDDDSAADPVDIEPVVVIGSIVLRRASPQWSLSEASPAINV